MSKTDFSSDQKPGYNDLDVILIRYTPKSWVAKFLNAVLRFLKGNYYDDMAIVYDSTPQKGGGLEIIIVDGISIERIPIAEWRGNITAGKFHCKVINLLRYDSTLYRMRLESYIAAQVVGDSVSLVSNVFHLGEHRINALLKSK